MRVQRNSRQAVVRIEYLIAGVICAFLIAGMIAVLVKYSRPRVPAFPPVAVRVDDEMPPVVTPTTETVGPSPNVGPGTPTPPIQPPPTTTQKPSVTTPYPNGQKRRIAPDAPTRVQAEAFDEGGEGIAYHDSETTNAGNNDRKDEGVDVFATAHEGSAVGRTSAGEWLNYSVDVAKAGKYAVTARLAGEAGTMRLIVDGDKSQTSDVAIPKTNDFGTYTSVDLGTVSLSAGSHVLQFLIVSGNHNFDWFEVAPAVDKPASKPASAPTTVAVKPPTTAAVVQTKPVELPEVINDTFEDMRVGQRPSGEGWTLGGAGASVQRSPQGEGQALALVDLSPSGDAWVRRSFKTLKTAAIFEASIRFTTASDGYGISLQGDKQKTAVFLRTSEMHLSYEAAGGKIVKLAPMKVNTWYKLRVETDFKKKVFDVYLDDQEVGKGIKFLNDVDHINAWLAGTAPQQTGTMHIANIRVRGK